MSRTLLAPAKLNLGLRILGRRPDGYHELESLFVPIDLADDLSLALRPEPGVRLRVSGAAGGVPADARNLAGAGGRGVPRRGRRAGGVALALDEARCRRPGGLGGGSSDAGAVLRGLAALARRAIAPPRCAELALAASAPTCRSSWRRAPALVSGIGERVLPVAGLPALPVVLAHPGAGLETKAVYAAFDAADSLTPPGPLLTCAPFSPCGRRRAPLRARWPELETSCAHWS